MTCDASDRPGTPGGPPGYIYEWVADQIAERIASGDLAPNTPLPAERRLADDYGVSLAPRGRPPGCCGNADW